MSFPLLKKITTEEELRMVIDAAHSDNHKVCFPSHLIEKDGQVAGCLSMATTPCVITWFSTKLLHARDTMSIINSAENLGALLGWQSVLVPCPESSPMFKYATKLGYFDNGVYHMFQKQLKV